MNVDAVFSLLSEAKKLCGHSEYVVIGSLSVLGLAEVAAIPEDMTMSIDVDCYALRDPGRTLDLQASLGEGSKFHRDHGIFLDPVNPNLPTLPEGWASRLIAVSRNGVTAHFLEQHDAAVSKLARGEERDVRWVKAGARANILSLPTVRLRMKATMFLDDEEHRAAVGLVEGIVSGAKPQHRRK
jgi:hypothetical protein